MPRPGQLPPRSGLTAAQAAAASYVGSAEHKVQRWWGGLPAARIMPDGKAHRPGKQDTSICRRTAAADRAEATGWVRAALQTGQYRFFEGDGTYPKHLWYRDADGQYWFGFAINQTLGTYKGWPVSEQEIREKFDRVA